MSKKGKGLLTLLSDALNPKDKEKFATLELAAGGVVSADKFEEGQQVYLRTNEGDIPLDAGDYDLKDGGKFTTDEEGVILSMVPAGAKEEEMKGVSQEDFGSFRNEVTEGMMAIAKAIGMSAQDKDKANAKDKSKFKVEESPEYKALLSKFEAAKKDANKKRPPLPADQLKAEKKKATHSRKFMRPTMARLLRSIEDNVPEDKKGNFAGLNIAV